MCPTLTIYIAINIIDYLDTITGRGEGGREGQGGTGTGKGQGGRDSERQGQGQGGTDREERQSQNQRERERESTITKYQPRKVLGYTISWDFVRDEYCIIYQFKKTSNILMTLRPVRHNSLRSIYVPLIAVVISKGWGGHMPSKTLTDTYGTMSCACTYTRLGQEGMSPNEEGGGGVGSTDKSWITLSSIPTCRIYVNPPCRSEWGAGRGPGGQRSRPCGERWCRTPG